MKTKSIKTALLSATLLSSAAAAFAQQSGGAFNLKASVIASGGGQSTSEVSSTGWVFSVTGTIGQPIAGGQMTNGAYSLTSGFWATIQLVQTLGAPAFGGIRVVAGNIVISWPVAATNYRLQSTTTVGNPSSWTDCADPITVVDGQNTVEVRPMPLPPMHFFRLKRIEP